MTCAVCGWSGKRGDREVNFNEYTQRAECRRCFHTAETAQAELVAQGQAEDW